MSVTASSMAPAIKLADPNELAREILSRLDEEEVLALLAETIQDQCRSAGCALFLIDTPQKSLRCAKLVGNRFNALQRRRIRLEPSLSRWASREEPFFADSIPRDKRTMRGILRQFAPARGTAKSLACIPILGKTETLGVIAIYDAAALSASSSEASRWLRIMAGFASIALENAREVEKLRRLTITDDCTGLFNSRHLSRVTEIEVYRSKRFGYPFSCLFIDLDHFKTVNDTYGHLIGSRLLREFGNIVLAELRRMDYVFRFGGDEFVILLPHTTKANAIVVAHRLLRKIRAQRFFSDEGIDVRVTASIGLVSFPEDGSSSEAIIRRADEMMYEVKNSTRDGVAVSGLLQER